MYVKRKQRMMREKDVKRSRLNWQKNTKQMIYTGMSQTNQDKN